MMSNQFVQLRRLTRRKTTAPSWTDRRDRLRDSDGGGWNPNETADRLVGGLDWDGSGDPPLHSLKKSTMSAVAMIEEENRILKEQVASLIQHVHGGNKSGNLSSPKATLSASDLGHARPVSLPTLNPVHSPISTHQSPMISALQRRDSIRGNAEGGGIDVAALDPALFSPRVGAVGGGRNRRGRGEHPKPSPRSPRTHPSGSVTERSHRSSVWADGRGGGGRGRRGGGGDAGGDEGEAVRKLQREMNRLKMRTDDKMAAHMAEKFALGDKVWSLEECLVNKDLELSLKEAELEHLRFLVKQQQEMMEEYAVEDDGPDREAVTEAGRGVVQQMKKKAGEFEEFLAESEEQIDEELEGAASKMIRQAQSEANRRKNVQEGMMGYKGPDGEYMNLACHSCGRMQLVRDQEIECNMDDDPVISRAPSGEGNVSTAKRRKKKRKAVIGVEPPFDRIIVDTDRWGKEKENRISLLTSQKIMKTVTDILCEKVIADMSDTASASSREDLKTYCLEYFLAVYGIRSLSDFYLLELIEGCKLFYADNPRIAHFSLFCGCTFAGEPLGPHVCDFYLEVYKELSTFLREPRAMEAKDADAKGKKKDMSKLAATAPAAMIAICAKKDIQVVFRRLSGWKALRRAFGICCDHKWMPSEYQTVDDIHADALGIAQQDVNLDEFMSFALDEYHKMNKRRRDNLKQLFLEADDDASGRLDYTEFQALIKQINPEKTQAEVAHMFRKVVEDQDDDSIDIDVFCDVMQEYGMGRYVDKVVFDPTASDGGEVAHGDQGGKTLVRRNSILESFKDTFQRTPSAPNKAVSSYPTYAAVKEGPTKDSTRRNQVNSMEDFM